MSKQPTTVMVANGDLQTGDWIWIRGQSVRVVGGPFVVDDNTYVRVVVRNRRGGQWAETMLRARKRRKRVV